MAQETEIYRVLINSVQFCGTLHSITFLIQFYSENMIRIIAQIEEYSLNQWSNMFHQVPSPKYIYFIALIKRLTFKEIITFLIDAVANKGHIQY